MRRAIVHACLVAVLALPVIHGSADAQASGPKGKRPVVQTIMCPPVLVPAGVHPIKYKDPPTPEYLIGQSAPGWNGYYIVRNPNNWPRIEKDIVMACYYQKDYAIFQVIGHRKCVVRNDHLGFDCRL